MTAKKPSSNPVKMTIHLPDETSISALRVILAYESELRGRSLGQTCYELVMKAADMENYPDEIIGFLDGVDKKSEQDAVKSSLEAFKTS